MPVFTDMMGRAVQLNAAPKRIVSIVPSQTELLYDLGLEDEVIGITKFCVHPEQWFRSKTRIGGTKQVHLEKVAALKPNLILANKEENIREQVEALAEIAPVWISDIKNLDDALQMIRTVGNLCGKQEKAFSIATKIEQDFQQLNRSEMPAKRVVYGIWRNPWMWAGNDTFIHDIIHRAGFENALNAGRYPEMNLQEIVALNPDIVLLSTEPYPFKEKHIEEIKAILPAADVQLVDGELFSWYGSRLLQTVPYLQALIHRLS